MKKEIATPEQIIIKLKKIFTLKTNYQLSEFLGIRPNTISSWKMRKAIPYARILAICHKYNISLNDIFYNNYRTKEKETLKLKKIPIIYINNHWEYYLNPLADSRLSYAFYPEDTAFNVIIQLAIENIEHIGGELVYFLCAKQSLEEILNTKTYVLLTKSKGFVYCDQIKVYIEERQIYSIKDKQFFNFKDVVEIFQCLGKYKC